MFTQHTAQEIYAKLIVSMSMSDAKEVLGFPPNYSPSPSEIAKAYRTKVLENHPDRGGDPRRMVEINVAKEVLDGKVRRDFEVERNVGEKKRRQVLKKDLETIERASKQAMRLVTQNSLEVLKFRSDESFKDYLTDTLADSLDNLHDAVEKSLRKPESKEDEKALKEIDSLVKDMFRITLQLVSKYRRLFDVHFMCADVIKEQYKEGEVVRALLQKLHSCARSIRGLLHTGFGPNNDDGVSLPDITVHEFDDVPDYLEGYLNEAKLFKPQEIESILNDLEKITTEVQDILRAHNVDLSIYSLQPDRAWYIPESFRAACEAIVDRSKTASAKDIGKRVAARFLVGGLPHR